MHVDVNDILKQEEGAGLDLRIEDERPSFEDVSLAAPLSGDIKVVGIDGSIIVAGNLQVEVNLECNRCLRMFTHHLTVPLQAEFRQQPGEDSFPIDRYGKIDLEEPIRQDILVHLPLQQLCTEDCNGIELKQKKDNHGSS